MAGNAQDDKKQQEQNIALRESLNNAYAAVEGAKLVQTFSALTFEDCADAQIARISGPDTQSRPNELNRIQRTLNNVVAAVAQIKAMPPEAFAKSDDTRDVNTPP